MNINELNKIKVANVESALADVKAGSGTFKEILDNVWNNIIIPLVDNEGNIVGISYDSKAGSVLEDNIAESKFMKKYLSKDIQGWVLKALKLKATQEYKPEVEETEEYIRVILDNDQYQYIEDYRNPYEEEFYPEDDEDKKDFYTRKELPETEEIEVAYIGDPDEVNLETIKRYLRNKYGFYITRNADIEYEYEPTTESYKVTGIEWGRRIK